MRCTISLGLLMVSLAAAGCASSEKSNRTVISAEDAPISEGKGSSVEPSDATDTEAEDSDAAPIPLVCAAGSSPFCVPNRKFVQRLCMDTFPGVALVMFRKGTPWTRGYLTRKTEAWNASGGAAPQRELPFDEEVILLRKRGSAGGIQVSGAGGGYDALTWDGACVTLAEEEVTLNVPPRPKTAPIVWRRLDPNLRETMKEDSELREAYRARRRECKGATMGEVSLKCVKADEGLSRAVEGYVRRGGELPQPTKLP